MIESVNGAIVPDVQPLVGRELSPTGLPLREGPAASASRSRESMEYNSPFISGRFMRLKCDFQGHADTVGATGHRVVLKNGRFEPY